MMEKSARLPCYDADVIVDYEKKSVEFTNKKNLSVKSNIVMSVSLSLIAIWLFMTNEVEISALQFFLSTALVIIFANLILLSPALYSIGFIRKILFQFRLKKVYKEVTIQNPYQEVKYFTRSLTPLIDIEYDEEVRKHLKSATLIERPPKKIFFNLLTVNKGKDLTILLEGNPKGILTIKEY
jgi:hypothetical protein